MPDLGLNWRLASVLKGTLRLALGWSRARRTVDGDDFGMMQQTIEDGAGGRDIAEQFAPFFDGSIGSHHGGPVRATGA